MVKVREEHPIREDGTVDLDLWLLRLQQQVEVSDIDQIRQACLLAKQARAAVAESDDDWSHNTVGSFRTGLEMAQILAELQQDQETLIAAILYRAVRERKLSLGRVQEQFGETIAGLIDGVLQMAAIGSRKNPRSDDGVLGTKIAQIDNVRKMLWR